MGCWNSNPCLLQEQLTTKPFSSLVLFYFILVCVCHSALVESKEQNIVESVLFPLLCGPQGSNLSHQDCMANALPLSHFPGLGYHHDFATGSHSAQTNLTKKLTLFRRLALNPWSSCLHLPSTGRHYHVGISVISQRLTDPSRVWRSLLSPWNALLNSKVVITWCAIKRVIPQVQRSACPCLPSIGIRGMSYHPQLPSLGLSGFRSSQKKGALSSEKDSTSEKQRKADENTQHLLASTCT